MLKLVILLILSVGLVSAVGLGIAQAQSQEIPRWIKSTAGWWANDQVSDTDFFNIIQFLIDREIITVPNSNQELVEQLELELLNLKSRTIKDIQDAYDDGYSDGLNDKNRKTINEIPRKDSDQNPTGFIIEAAKGSGFVGCEETAKGCYIPSTAIVDVGERVIFSNTDNVAHTFTSGMASGVGSIGTVFDSGLVIAGSSYEWSPTEAGDQPYFCIVHPWMIGMIIVE